VPDPDSTPRRPAGLLAAGGRLWDSVTDAFELEEHESALLLQAARTVDTLADLDTAMRRVGVLVDSPQGIKAHPGSG